MSISSTRRRGASLRSSLPVAPACSAKKLAPSLLALALWACTQPLLAQSVTGGIAGNITHGTGLKIEAEQVGTGARRTLTPKSDHYALSGLASGVYIVTATKDGQTIAVKRLLVSAGATATLDIDGDPAQATTLGTVSVTATAASPIDVTTPFSSTIVHKEDLDNLAVSQSITGIAAMQSNVRSESATGTSLPAINGASAAENRYYVNGFDVTYDYTGLGYTEPTYEVMDTTELITHGFSAKYGNAVGGVMSSVTKTGTNEFHGGTMLNYTPATGRLNPNSPSVTDPSGGWYDYNKGAHSDSVLSQYVYLSGPLIKDKLFFNVVGKKTYPYNSRSFGSTYRYDDKDTSKNGIIDLKWNISDRQSLNAFYSRTSSDSSTDYSKLTTGYDYTSNSTYYASYSTKDVAKTAVGNYQWDITDTFHVKAMGGYLRRDLGYDGNYYDLPYVRKYTSSSAYTLLSGVSSSKPDDFIYTKKGYRLDFEWELGNHTIGFGGEWYKTFVHSATTYPNYWALRLVPSTGKVNDVSGFTPGSYYAVHYNYSTGGSFDATKTGMYIEDNWRVADDVNVYLGLRRDNYDNATSTGASFAKMGINEPRLGVVWDIDGNGERKLSATVGRYALQIPLSVNKTVGTSTSYNYDYYTYTGLDSGSVPTGRNKIGDTYVSSASEVNDARLVATQNLKPSYEDQFAITYQQSLGGITDGWLGRAAQGWYGSATGYFHDLKNVTEDNCSEDSRNSYIRDVLGYSNYSGETVKCILVNPGKDEVLLRDVDNNGSLEKITIPSSYIGIEKVKRRSLGLTLELTHPYSNHFYAEFGYTWQHLYGNYDGAMNVTQKSTSNVSANSAFDLASLAAGSTGNLSADIRHSFKANGYYQWDNGFRVGGAAQLYSGRPLSCLGADPDGGSSYDGDYFYCDGVVVPRGSAGRLSWNWSVDLDLGYTLKLADNWGAIRFDLRMQNATNRHGVVDRSETYEDDTGENLATYGLPTYQSPRSTWFTARYDF